MQAWLQEFAWTQGALPALKAHRDQQLQALMAEEEGLEEGLLPTLLPGTAAWYCQGTVEVLLLLAHLCGGHVPEMGTAVARGARPRIEPST